MKTKKGLDDKFLAKLIFENFVLFFTYSAIFYIVQDFWKHVSWNENVNAPSKKNFTISLY
jgi:hypothetical protein